MPVKLLLLLLLMPQVQRRSLDAYRELGTAEPE